MCVYDDVKEKASPFIKAYRDDLLVHDKKDIQENPDTPFLHFTGETGTHLAKLIPAGEYPIGRVNYLFGVATREEILDGQMEVIPGMSNRYGRGKLILHYDGKFLKEITQSQANGIADDYKEEIKRAWQSC